MSDQGHNSIDATLAKLFLAEVRRTFEEEETERASWRGKAAAIKERRKQVYERAEDSGIPAKLLKARIKQWQEDVRIAQARARRAEAVPEDADDRALFEALCQALGDFADTPLGEAAVNAAKSDEDIVQTNVTRLRAGVTGLPGADAAEA